MRLMSFGRTFIILLFPDRDEIDLSGGITLVILLEKKELSHHAQRCEWHGLFRANEKAFENGDNRFLFEELNEIVCDQI